MIHYTKVSSNKISNRRSMIYITKLFTRYQHNSRDHLNIGRINYPPYAWSGYKLQNKNNRSGEMVIVIQESGGFSRTLDVVKDSIWRALLKRVATHPVTAAIPTCNIWRKWVSNYNRAPISVFRKKIRKEPGWGSDHRIPHQYRRCLRRVR